MGLGDKSRLLTGDTVQEGDAIIALASSGVHSNGFSLVRRAFDVENRDLSVYSDELGATIGETLLTPTRIYVKPLLALMQAVTVKAAAHITGGGFYENIPRCLPKGRGAKIERSAVQVLPVFDMIGKLGNIPERDMFNTFNMGVGMCTVVPQAEADAAIRCLEANGVHAYALGEVTADEGIKIC